MISLSFIISQLVVSPARRFCEIITKAMPKLALLFLQPDIVYSKNAQRLRLHASLFVPELDAAPVDMKFSSTFARLDAHEPIISAYCLPSREEGARWSANAPRDDSRPARFSPRPSAAFSPPLFITLIFLAEILGTPFLAIDARHEARRATDD